MGKKLTYVDVKELFEKEGYTLISTEYVGVHSRLEYVCPNGHTHSSEWRNFRYGKRCLTCHLLSRNKEGNSQWKGGVRDKKLPLYDTYAKQLEKYNNIHLVVQDNLEILGVTCKYCDKIFIPSTSKVRDRLRALDGSIGGERNFYCSNTCKQMCPTYRRRKYQEGENPNKNTRPLQIQWANMVKERDNNTCQKCGAKNKVMYAHHIDPVINNPIESADIDNGITLCKKCDKLAHQTVGCSYSELRC